MQKFIFVLCSHNSGSTTLWQLIKTSPNVSALPGEGQWLEAVEPILRENPWDPENKLPWGIIKAEWEKVWDVEKPLLLEKSPPELMHAFEIEKAFPNAYFVVMMRNPYAFCEGTRRKYLTKFTLAEIAERWVEHAKMQRRNIQELQHVLAFTYEEFTGEPGRIVQRLLEFIPELEKLDQNIIVSRKSVFDYISLPIMNFNAAQIAKLSDAELREINQVLKKYPEIMKFFGYTYEQVGFGRKLANIRVKLMVWYFKNIVRNKQRLMGKLGMSKDSRDHAV